MNNQKQARFAFFGSSGFSLIVLDELEALGLIPTYVVTTVDKPQGRKMIVTPTPVKTWAASRNIPVYDPEKLDSSFIEKLRTKTDVDTYLVASYGKMIPQEILDIPKYQVLNIHPSLLPRFRGASPLQSAILEDVKDTGVSIMVIDADMDHGPIIAQENIHIDVWPNYENFKEIMAKTGARLFAKVLPDWIAGNIKAVAQKHSLATFTKKIKKEDGLIDFSVIDFAKNDKTNIASQDAQYLAFRKIQAFHEWPHAFFFIEHSGKKIRVKITKASWKSAIDTGNTSETNKSRLTIEKVIPEGSKEMSYEDFERGYLVDTRI